MGMIAQLGAPQDVNGRYVGCYGLQRGRVYPFPLGGFAGLFLGQNTETQQLGPVSNQPDRHPHDSGYCRHVMN